MKRLFDWLAARRGQPGFDDMNAVTEADLIAYEDESLSAMVATGTWKQPTVDDHVIQIKAGFSHARRRLHIDSDPSPVLRSYHRADDGANNGDTDAAWEKYSKTRQRISSPVPPQPITRSSSLAIGSRRTTAAAPQRSRRRARTTSIRTKTAAYGCSTTP